MKVTNLAFQTPRGAEILFENWRGTDSIFAVTWQVEQRQIRMDFGYSVGCWPTPNLDGVAIVYPDIQGAPYLPPNNAVIINSDGTLRFQLKCPSLLARYVPGYNMPEKYIRPWGFSQIGSGSFGFGNRFTMWAYITIADTDCYETRYFDPDTGEFDQEHYSVSRW